VLSGINPALAFLAGLASFVSPCVLPLVPAYLAYLGANSSPPHLPSPRSGEGGPAAARRGRMRPGGVRAADGGDAGAAIAERPHSQSIALAGAAFVAGLSLIFILFFYVFSLAVQPIRPFVPVVAGVVVIVMALHVAGVIRIPFLDTEYRVMRRTPQNGGVAGGFLLGMGFASGWTPCIGITLSAVLSSAVTIGATPQGLSLMIAYCIGLGVPFLALAFALESTRPLLRFVNEHRRAIDLASAGVLVIMGVLLLTNRLTWLSAGLTQLIPSWPSPSL
jgi:cytochrome c-type biogenesis protein